MTKARGIVCFDGVCNLCNGFVDFLLRRDRDGLLRFATLQSEPAEVRAAVAAHDRVPQETVIFVTPQRVYHESGAVIRILAGLGGLWPLLRVALIIPAPLRDAVYRSVARRRYGWFGRRETCRVPSPSERGRFVE